MLNTVAALVDADTRECSISTIQDRAEWETLFARAPFPHLPQSWMYGEGKRAEWTVDRLIIHSPRGPLGLAQVLNRQVLGFPVARINRGPLFLAAHPSPETRAAVLRTLRRHWRFLRRGLLLIAPALPAGEESARELRAAGFLKRAEFAWGSSLLNLAPPVEEIFTHLTPEWRRHVRKAERNGVRIEVRTDADSFEWLLARHAENMRAKNFVGPSPEFVRRMLAASPDDVSLVRAIIDGEPHAAALVARFGRHAEYYIGWFDDVARRAAAGNLLMWNAVTLMKAAGCDALDLGGFSVTDRYGQFKRGMRGDEYRLAGEWLAF
ncbi:MAG: GNAT family N-acetyltransferase [Steroidobacteraceae bacterium]|nr:GNAT family N-acetyltransferase [Steroidobacteraceae bacterium]